MRSPRRAKCAFPRDSLKRVPWSSDYTARYRDDFQQTARRWLQELHALAEQLQHVDHHSEQQLPETLFDVYTDLIESDIEEPIAQELIERLRHEPQLNPHDRVSLPGTTWHRFSKTNCTSQARSLPPRDRDGSSRWSGRLAWAKRRRSPSWPPITASREQARGTDHGRHLSHRRRRTTATYADIIDLPMEVVSTPREMREARARMSDLDLVLMDTAGRSPRDEVRIQELKSMLAEAAPEEVHLVLSAVGGARSLATTAERFATVGTTAMIVTKLDEATALGNLISVTRSSGLPVSYLTDGQNVPDDIQIAHSRTWRSYP